MPDVPRAAGRAGEHEVGDIRAGDEQHDGDHRGKRKKRVGVLCPQPEKPRAKGSSARECASMLRRFVASANVSANSFSACRFARLQKRADARRFRCRHPRDEIQPGDEVLPESTADCDRRCCRSWSCSVPHRDCRVSGSQTSASESVQMPTNPGGPTPMIVTGRPLTVMRLRRSRRPSCRTTASRTRR